MQQGCLAHMVAQTIWQKCIVNLTFFSLIFFFNKVIYILLKKEQNGKKENQMSFSNTVKVNINFNSRLKTDCKNNIDEYVNKYAS